jgi:hypothetical protein
MSASAKEQDRFRKILADLLKRDENKECADCTSQRPTWCSVNLGLFICLECSGIHRSLGTHISFVRSATIDDWKQEQIDNMIRVGNAKGKAYWEANLPPNKQKPAEFNTQAIKEWIDAKYVRKLYIDKDAVPPHLVGKIQPSKSPSTAQNPPKVQQQQPVPVKYTPQATLNTTTEDSAFPKPKPRSAIGSTGSSQSFQRISWSGGTTTNPFYAPAIPPKINTAVSTLEVEPDESVSSVATVGVKKKKKVPKDETDKKKKKKKPSSVSNPTSPQSSLIDFDMGDSNNLNNAQSGMHLSHSTSSLVSVSKRENDKLRLNKSFDSTPNSAPSKNAASPFSDDEGSDDDDDDSDKDLDEVFSSKKNNTTSHSNGTSPTLSTSGNLLESKKESILSLFNYSPTSPTGSQNGFNNNMYSKPAQNNSFF